MEDNVKRRSNFICELASLLLSLTAIVLFTYMTLTYINIRQYETELKITVAGNDVISLYNVVGIKKIESIRNKYNKNILIIYKNVTEEEIDSYINKLLAEKYEKSDNKNILVKTQGNTVIKVLISNIDEMVAINYYMG